MTPNARTWPALVPALSNVWLQSVQTASAVSGAGVCVVCHNLSYTSVQKHDARLDRFLRVPEREIVRLVKQDKNMTWKPLALRAGYIRIGMIRKY